MLDKNFISFLVVSSIILLAYSWLFAPQQEPAATGQPTETTTQPTPQPVVPTAPAILPPAVVATPPNQQSGKSFAVQTAKTKTKINNLNGVLQSLTLSDYAYASEYKAMAYDYVLDWFMKPTPAPVVDLEQRVNMIADPRFGQVSLFENAPDILFSVDQSQLATNNRLILSASLPSGLQVTKTFQFINGSYQVQLSIQIRNNAGQALALEPTVHLGTGNQAIETGYNPSLKEGVSYADNDLSTYDEDDLPLELNQFDWAGIMDRYFITAVKQPNESWHASYQVQLESFLNKGVQTPGLELKHQSVILEAGETWQQTLELYLGPKQVDAMQEFDESLAESLDLVLAIVAQPMLSALRWYHKWVNNWGLAIIMLTITVRILLLPLAYKGMKSMKRMSKLSPRMKALRAKHKDHKDKLNKEIMELYRRNKVNPVGGCLPLLGQIPIFIALYWALLPAIELRHQPFFFWIQDLSMADHTLVLPLLMGVSMFVQQRITPMGVGMDPTQQKIMQWLPLMFVFFFLTFPSGLVLYWVVSNIITIFQQWLFNRAKVKAVVD